MAIHTDFSYVHHPELLDLNALESAFRLLEATVPAALENLETAIETTNDLNQDLELDRTIVTLEGILLEDPEQCQTLANRIIVEMDEQLDVLVRTEGIPLQDREHRDYDAVFDGTARRIYEKIVGHPCPSAVKIE
jgi:hypothetical protein